MPADYNTTAAALSVSPVPETDSNDGSSPFLQSIRPPWSQTHSTSFSRAGRGSFSSGGFSGRGPRTGNMRDRAINTSRRLMERGARSWARMTPLQRIGAVIAATASLAFGIGVMVLTGKIFEWLEPVAEDWEKSPLPYIVLWLLTVVVSFPPLFGWSAIGTVCGYLFGVWKGYVLRIVIFPAGQRYHDIDKFTDGSFLPRHP